MLQPGEAGGLAQKRSRRRQQLSVMAFAKRLHGRARGEQARGPRVPEGRAAAFEPGGPAWGK